MRAEKKNRAEADCRGEELGRKEEEDEEEEGTVEEAKRERERQRKERKGVSVRRDGPLKALKRVLDVREGAHEVTDTPLATLCSQDWQ